MRVLLLGDDSALHLQLRSSVNARWLQSEVSLYNPQERGPLAEDIRAQGFDAVVLDHAWCDLDQSRNSIRELKRLVLRPGFAPILSSAKEAGMTCARRR